MAVRRFLQARIAGASRELAVSGREARDFQERGVRATWRQAVEVGRDLREEFLIKCWNLGCGGAYVGATLGFGAAVYAAVDELDGPKDRKRSVRVSDVLCLPLVIGLYSPFAVGMGMFLGFLTTYTAPVSVPVAVACAVHACLKRPPAP